MINVKLVKMYRLSWIVWEIVINTCWVIIIAPVGDQQGHCDWVPTIIDHWSRSHSLPVDKVYLVLHP